MDEIEELAELLFTEEEISIITGAKLNDLRNTNHPAGHSFIKGRLQAKAVLRKATYEMAKNGSTEAIKMFDSILRSQEMQNQRRKS